MNMIDAILYIASLDDAGAWYRDHRPDLLARDEAGEIAVPEVVAGIARTPTHISGDLGLSYVRVTAGQLAELVACPQITVLARRPYAPGVQDQVYADLAADPEASALYDSVYSRAPYEVEDGEGGTVTVTPPARFGQMG
ncbi:hypothetical protein [Celeribacter indicus]|uniref:Uncharacterized protein n=1 Tax=Celeribacter indicus TaxID=1208324 RepID=A0A0B5DXX6_9RHOB|nr:hypothetical protein [Celeribacter indicus]AJE46005.1 hypothetical protein P73_1290 [Celeribacter indicus]SDX32670.1 hypothetical protein SAMN05443573_1225 [Celeribacter indicus]